MIELLPLIDWYIIYTVKILLICIGWWSYCPWKFGIFCTLVIFIWHSLIFELLPLNHWPILYTENRNVRDWHLFIELLPLIDWWQLTCIVWLSYYPWKVGIFCTLVIFIWHSMVDSHSPRMIDILYMYTDYIKLMFGDWVIALDRLAFSVHR